MNPVIKECACCHLTKEHGWREVRNTWYPQSWCSECRNKKRMKELYLKKIAVTPMTNLKIFYSQKYPNDKAWTTRSRKFMATKLERKYK